MKWRWLVGAALVELYAARFARPACGHCRTHPGELVCAYVMLFLADLHRALFPRAGPGHTMGSGHVGAGQAASLPQSAQNLRSQTKILATWLPTRADLTETSPCSVQSHFESTL